MSAINFKEVKERVSIHQAMQYLALNEKPDGDKFRARCPACEEDRALVVTPAKGVFYCHKAKDGGDQLALVAHVKQVKVRDAAEMLIKHFGDPQKIEKAVDKALKERGIKSLDHLEFDHSVLGLAGIPADVCEALGLGYSKKGPFAGRICVPIRTTDGALVGYVGLAISPDEDVPFIFHKSIIDQVQALLTNPETKEMAPEQKRAMFKVVG